MVIRTILGKARSRGVAFLVAASVAVVSHLTSALTASAMTSSLVVNQTLHDESGALAPRGGETAVVGLSLRAKVAAGGADVLVAVQADDALEKLKSSSAADPQGRAAGVERASAAFDAAKARVREAAGLGGALVRDFGHLPVQVIHVATTQELDHLASTPGVVAVSLSQELTPDATANLSLIRQPEAISVGIDGNGTATAVIDTGADWTRTTDLGDCAGGYGTGTCRIAGYTSVSGASGLDSDTTNYHGTNVTSIVALVAPRSRIYVYNVAATGGTTDDASIAAAFDDLVATGATRGIRAVNLSMGVKETYFTSECGAYAMASVIEAVRSVGIVPVMSAGNFASVNGVSHVGVGYPSCLPGVVRVGSVNPFDAAVSSWSQGGPLLTVYAPGEAIDAGGSVLNGTSQAAPHVAGAIADVAGVNPTATTAQLALSITISMRSITDPLNSQSHPLLDVIAAAASLPYFTDLGASQFKTDIAWLAVKKITTGTSLPNGTSLYKPLDPVSRAAMAAFFYRLDGSPAFEPPMTSPFVDVSPSGSFYREICWLAAKGITKGVSVNGKLYYQPEANVTRAAMAAFMYRYGGSEAYTEPTTSPFADLTPSTGFYKEICWLASKGITRGITIGTSLYFQPSSPVTREAMAAFLHRLYTALGRS